MGMEEIRRLVLQELKENRWYMLPSAEGISNGKNYCRKQRMKLVKVYARHVLFKTQSGAHYSFLYQDLYAVLCLKPEEYKAASA